MSQPSNTSAFLTNLLGSLRATAASGQSGTLTVHGTRGTKKLFFHEGQVLAVASADASERLGHYLVGWGLLTEPQLAALLEEQRSVSRGLGELAVARRLVDADAMRLLMRIRAEDAIFDLVRWEHGEYRFARDVTPVRGYLELRLPVGPLLADLERLLETWRLWGEKVPGPRDVPHVVPRSEFKTLSMREADILRLVDGHHSLSEVAMQCRTSQFEVVVILQNHARDGLVRFAAAAPAAAAPASEKHWVEMLREAENSLAFADLLEAYDLLCRALATADTSRGLQEQAMKIEEAIRRQIDLADTAVLRLDGAPAAASALGPDEARLVGLADGRLTLAEILDRVGGDRMRQRLLAHSLAQHGILGVVPPAPSGR